jgi:hypothetical protein
MLLRVSHVAPRASLATPSPSCGSPCDPCYFSSPCVTPLASPTISCPLLCVGSMCVSCYTFSPCSFSCVPCYFVSPATVPRVSPMAPPEAAESRIMNPSFFFLFLSLLSLLPPLAPRVYTATPCLSCGSPRPPCYSVSLMWLPMGPMLLLVPLCASGFPVSLCSFSCVLCYFVSPATSCLTYGSSDPGPRKPPLSLPSY